MPGTTPRSQLYVEGKLPEFALFSSTPPSAAFADITPPTTPANLAEVFALGVGDGNLLQNSYRLMYLEDAQSRPDGGFHTVTSGVAVAATAADPYVARKQDFAAAKALVAAAAIEQGATDGGALAVAEAYLATLAAPFCFAATRTFFGKH